MSSFLNYIILDKPDVSNIKSIEINGNQAFSTLQTALQSKHGLLLDKFEKVSISMSLEDDEFNEKLRNFTFNATTRNWRTSKKLSAIFTPDDLNRDDLHLIISA